MAKWDWLEKPAQPPTWGFLARVLLKAGVLFLILNLLFAFFKPMESLGRLSLYNGLLRGRERLPYGENPSQSYNLSLYNIPAMFASHIISRPKAAEEYRVLLIGDSNTWGWRLENKDTLAAQINALDLRTADNRHIIAYNLGYPVMSLTKDLLLLDEATRYQPDQIIWLVTLESLPLEKQYFPPLVQNNPDRINQLLPDDLKLAFGAYDSQLVHPDLFSLSIVGQRRSLADLLRLQLYGFSWAATGVDQFIPAEFDLRQSDFEADTTWYDFDAENPFSESDLALDVLALGAERFDVPLLLINEPIYVSSGQNSDLRYNSWYPRWAYSAYREMLFAYAQERSIPYLNLWDTIAPDEFTDSPVHLTPVGTQKLAQQIANVIADER